MGKALGIVALIFGIFGLAFPILYLIPLEIPFTLASLGLNLILSIPCSTVAIICGAIGIKKDDSPGLAIAGLVLGSIGILVWIGYFVARLLGY